MRRIVIFLVVVLAVIIGAVMLVARLQPTFMSQIPFSNLVTNSTIAGRIQIESEHPTVRIAALSEVFKSELINEISKYTPLSDKKVKIIVSDKQQNVRLNYGSVETWSYAVDTTDDAIVITLGINGKLDQSTASEDGDQVAALILQAICQRGSLSTNRGQSFEEMYVACEEKKDALLKSLKANSFASLVRLELR